MPPQISEKTMGKSPRVKVDDPVLQEKLDAIIRAHEEQQSAVLPGEVGEYPRYVFSRDAGNRDIGGLVKVRNALDEESAGGRILEKVGPAYLVEIQSYGIEVIVHEPDDSWQ